MYAKGTDLVSFLEEFAPSHGALPGDNTGLQWGDLEKEVPSLLLALDFSEDVLEEAMAVGASFILTHHPFLYHPLSKIDLNDKCGALLTRALKENITLYSAHTNLDVAPRGVSYALGKLLGLKNMKPLRPTGKDDFQKLVVFVPKGYENSVRDAISEAGAGWVGNYSHCTYQLLGTGTFLPREGSSPFLGDRDVLQKVAEYRLETIIPACKQQVILEALFAAHPYEEVAFDLYPLANRGQVWGLGMVGNFEKRISLQELLNLCQQLLQPSSLRYVGEPSFLIDRLAVLGGSGRDYLVDVLQGGIPAFLTGDIMFHDFQKALHAGLVLIDAGHDATEKPIIPLLARFLEEKMREKEFDTQVLSAKKEPASLWQVLK